MTTDPDSLEDAAVDILAFMAECRILIWEGDALLRGVEAGGPRKNAHKVLDGVLRSITYARQFARSDVYAACAESLNGLADDIEALRERARRLL